MRLSSILTLKYLTDHGWCLCA